MKSYVISATAMLLLGCSTPGGLVNTAGDAWRVTGIANTAPEAAGVGRSQANGFCAKTGQSAFTSSERSVNDMAGRYVYTLDFQCTARGTSPEAQGEARMRGYQRDCAIAGFTLGSPENIKCANTLAEKATPKPAATPPGNAPRRPQ